MIGTGRAARCSFPVANAKALLRGSGTVYTSFCLCAVLSLLLYACDRRATGHFPLAPGYEWAYDISRTFPELAGSVTQKSIVRNLPARTVDDITYHPQVHANGKTYFFTRSTDGISRQAPGDDGAELVIGYPLSVGTEWSAAAGLHLFDLPKKLEENWDRISRGLVLDYTITSLDDPVDVPAGYFPRCLRIDAVGFLDLPRRLMLGIRIIKVEQTQWYAPGTGLIKMTRKEYAIPNLYPSEYTQVLASFK